MVTEKVGRPPSWQGVMLKVATFPSYWTPSTGVKSVMVILMLVLALAGAAVTSAASVMSATVRRRRTIFISPSLPEALVFHDGQLDGSRPIRRAVLTDNAHPCQV